MTRFEPPPFRPHPWLPSGHLQTLAGIGWGETGGLRQLPAAADSHVVPLADGDAVVLHEDRPPAWLPGAPSLLLVHGLCGCHAASYMVRLATRFFDLGVRVFRIDLRGCGAGAELAEGLSHAGRSDDLVTALNWLARRTSAGPLGVVAVSLGGNLLLRALGRIGAGADPEPEWWGRLAGAVAVAPPIDLQRCADNMQRWALRPYNRYFIRLLLDRAPRRLREREAFQAALAGARPRTLWELDERVTAPLSGFSGAVDYYRQSASAPWLTDNPVPTLILAAADDPIVPADCFTRRAASLPETTRLCVTPRGGHVGFVDRSRRSWMDEAVSTWFESLFRSPSLTEQR